MTRFVERTDRVVNKTHRLRRDLLTTSPASDPLKTVTVKSYTLLGSDDNRNYSLSSHPHPSRLCSNIVGESICNAALRQLIPIRWFRWWQNPAADSDTLLGTVALMRQHCVRLSSSVCMECIVAKQFVLEQKLLLTAYRKSYMRNRLVPKQWPWPLFRGRSRSCQPLRCQYSPKLLELETSNLIHGFVWRTGAHIKFSVKKWAWPSIIFGCWVLHTSLLWLRQYGRLSWRQLGIL